MEAGSDLSFELLKKAKEKGFSDATIASLISKTEEEVRALRKEMGITPSFKIVDTCAAEFDAKTNYFYSTYFGETDGDISRKEKNARSLSDQARFGSAKALNLITVLFTVC